MVAVKKSQNIEDVLKGIIIPSPPQIIADLQMEMAMPDPDMNAMADLISKDVGLSGAVLKTVNSPIYGSSREVVSINQGVMMLGMKTIVDIVNTLCVRNTMSSFDDMTDNVYQTLTRFWDSASDVANVCEMVGKKVGMTPSDNAYLIGLFHNIGIALMIAKHDSYLDFMVDSYAQQSSRIVDIENKEFDTNHAVVSYYAAKSWKIDKQVCKVISIHHNLDIFTKGDLENSKTNSLLAVLKIAEHIVGLYRILGNQEVDHEWEKIGDNALLHLGLSGYDFDDLQSQAADLGFGQQMYFR